MSDIRYLLLGDGPSDRILSGAVEWAFREHAPTVRFEGRFAHAGQMGGGVLRARFEKAVALYSPDVVFVHRDSEQRGEEARLARREEISSAACEARVPVVPVVPIRMTEAWFIYDVTAIRAAANNPNGRRRLSLPDIGSLERVHDPKELLFELLREASELSRGRLRKFNVGRARLRLGELILDYSPLRVLTAFSEFENDFIVAMDRVGAGNVERDI